MTTTNRDFETELWHLITTEARRTCELIDASHDDVKAWPLIAGSFTIAVK